MSDLDNNVTVDSETPLPETKLIARASKRATKLAHNQLVLGSAVQLGVDIVRELMDTGNLEAEVTDTDVSMAGVTKLITSTINRELRNKLILESIK